MLALRASEADVEYSFSLSLWTFLPNTHCIELGMILARRWQKNQWFQINITSQRLSTLWNMKERLHIEKMLNFVLYRNLLQGLLPIFPKAILGNTEWNCLEDNIFAHNNVRKGNRQTRVGFAGKFPSQAQTSWFLVYWWVGWGYSVNESWHDRVNNGDRADWIMQMRLQQKLYLVCARSSVSDTFEGKPSHLISMSLLRRDMNFTYQRE